MSLASYVTLQAGGSIDHFFTRKGVNVKKLKRFGTASIAVAIIALGGCTASHNATGLPTRQEASSTRVANEIDRIAAANAALPHGAELESGTPTVITDGNVHMMIPPSATITRTADGLVVTYNGHISRFSARATAVTGGDYHRYAAPAK